MPIENIEDNVLCKVKSVEQNLAKIIKKDLPRTVDLRRYWFFPIEDIEHIDYRKNMNEYDWNVSSFFDLSKIHITGDIKYGDFVPGKGIYSKKSYIMKYIHSPNILDKLNILKDVLHKNGEKWYSFDVIKREFTATALEYGGNS
jgi:hypothetical protein